MISVEYQSQSGDLGADFISGPMNVTFVTGISVQVTFTGAPVGSLRLEMSNDAGTTWSTISEAVAVTETGSHAWDLETFGKLLRVKYVRTSGEGSISVHAHSKRE